MKKKKLTVVYDQEYIDRLEEFQEYLRNGIPEVRVEDYEDESNDDIEIYVDDVETVWIIGMKRFYENKCQQERLITAFRSKTKADCYLRHIKHELEDRYKCYGGKYNIIAYLRSNRKLKYVYYIEEVYYSD